MTNISNQGKGKNEQGAENLAADLTNHKAHDDGRPSEEEPCLGVVPFHGSNIVPSLAYDQMNKQGNRHG